MTRLFKILFYSKTKSDADSFKPIFYFYVFSIFSYRTKPHELKRSTCFYFERTYGKPYDTCRIVSMYFETTIMTQVFLSVVMFKTFKNGKQCDIEKESRKLFRKRKRYNRLSKTRNIFEDLNRINRSTNQDRRKMF